MEKQIKYMRDHMKDEMPKNHKSLHSSLKDIRSTIKAIEAKQPQQHRPQKTWLGTAPALGAAHKLELPVAAARTECLSCQWLLIPDKAPPSLDVPSPEEKLRKLLLAADHEAVKPPWGSAQWADALVHELQRASVEPMHQVLGRLQRSYVEPSPATLQQPQRLQQHQQPQQQQSPSQTLQELPQLQQMPQSVADLRRRAALGGRAEMLTVEREEPRMRSPMRPILLATPAVDSPNLMQRSSFVPGKLLGHDVLEQRLCL